MPKITAKYIIKKYNKQITSEYQAKKIKKYAKEYNLTTYQIEELINENKLEIDSEILGNLTVIEYNPETDKFTIKEISKPLYSDYFSNSEFSSEDNDY